MADLTTPKVLSIENTKVFRNLIHLRRMGLLSSQSPARNTALKRVAAYSQIIFTDNSSFHQCHRYAAAENWHNTGSGRRHKAAMRQCGRNTLSTRATSAKRRRCDSLTSSGLPPFSTRRRLMSSIVAFSSSCACYWRSHEQKISFIDVFRGKCEGRSPETA